MAELRTPNSLSNRVQTALVLATFHWLYGAQLRFDLANHTNSVHIFGWEKLNDGASLNNHPSISRTEIFVVYCSGLQKIVLNLR